MHIISHEEKVFSNKEGGLTKAAGDVIIEIYLKVEEVCPSYGGTLLSIHSE